MQENTPFGVSELLVQAQRMKKWYEEALHAVAVQYGLTMNELSVLLFLANNPAYKTASDIVDVRRIKANLVSVNVDKLVQEGLLERRPVPGDRRKTELHCTEMAQPIIQRGQALQEAFFARLMQGIDPAQLRAFYDTIARMGENLDAILEGDL